MKLYLLVAVTIIALLVQVSFLPALRPFGVVPNLVVVVVAAAALSGPLVSAMIIAISSGIVLDLASGSDFGLMTGLLALTVLLCAFISRSGLRTGIRLQLIIVTLAISTISPLIATLELLLAGGRIDFGTLLFGWLIFLTLNLCLGLSFGPLCVRLAKINEYYGE